MTPRSDRPDVGPRAKAQTWLQSDPMKEWPEDDGRPSARTPASLARDLHRCPIGSLFPRRTKPKKHNRPAGPRAGHLLLMNQEALRGALDPFQTRTAMSWGPAHRPFWAPAGIHDICGKPHISVPPPALSLNDKKRCASLRFRTARWPAALRSALDPADRSWPGGVFFSSAGPPRAPTLQCFAPGSPGPFGFPVRCLILDRPG